MADIDKKMVLPVVTLVLSLAGAILGLASAFGEFFIGIGWRYSCITCEYAEPFDLVAVITASVCLFAVAGISVPGIVKKQGFPKQLRLAALGASVVALLVIAAGGIAFGIQKSVYEWYFDAGFYGPIIGAALCAVVLALYPKLAD